MDADELLTKVEESLTDRDQATLLDELRLQPNAAELLETLSEAPNLEVRGWVPGAARQVLGKRAMPLLAVMLDDPDADIRGLALDAIEELDPSSLSTMLERLRRNLGSADDYEALASGWRLVRLRDQVAIPGITAFRDRFEPWTWQYKAASVQLLALTDADAINRLIDEHDHDRMRWLSYAATLSGSQGSQESLQRCATGAPDEACRKECQRWLPASR